MYKKIFIEQEETTYRIYDNGQVMNEKTGRYYKGIIRNGYRWFDLRWKNKKFHLIVFDMSHVNDALRHYKTKPVDGIIGADILLKGKAIIDYCNHCLYLKWFNRNPDSYREQRFTQSSQR